MWHWRSLQAFGVQGDEAGLPSALKHFGQMWAGETTA